MVSAQLDGEDDPADRPLVDEHLAGCADCRDWLDRAATVNRLTRTGPVAQVPGPDRGDSGRPPTGAGAATAVPAQGGVVRRPRRRSGLCS